MNAGAVGRIPPGAGAALLVVAALLGSCGSHPAYAADGSTVAAAPTSPPPPPPAAGSPPALYGPSLPRAARGALATIDWPPAPPQVPPALEAAINIVTRTYPTVGAARSALRAAASDLRAARLERLPSASGTVLMRYRDRSPVPQFGVELPLWDAGRIGADVRRARAGEDGSAADYVDTINNLALTTAQTYFDIIRLTVREQLLAGSVAEHRRLVGTMERRVGQEVSPLADLDLARSRTAQVEQDFNNTHAARLTSIRILTQLVSDPSFDVGPAPGFDPAIDLPAPDALEDQAAAFSPRLRRLQADIDVARAEFDSRKAALFPQLNAAYSYDDFFHHRIGGQVRFQNAASQLPQIDAARLRIDVAVDNRRGGEAQLRREVASDLIQFDSARSRATTSRAAAETAAAVSESFMRQFIAGRRSWLDVMNQLREAVSARISQTEDEMTTMAAAARLLIESGRWRPGFAGPGGGR